MTEPPVKHSAVSAPRGSYPVMVTAFQEDGSFDWEGVDRLTDFCIETDSAGIFACGLSAEIDRMENQEKVALAERIVRRTAGRIPVVAGAIGGGTIEQQAELVRQIHATGADVVTLSVCQLAAKSEDDQVWLRHAKELLAQIPETVPLALYECPWPYWRLLSAETIRWAAGSGRFCFLKDTCCNMDTIRTRLEIIRGSRLHLFNANTETLLDSLRAGAEGFCGIGANYFPELFGWLCTHYQDDPARAEQLQHFLTTCVGLTEGEFYPVSAKEYLRQRGLQIGLFSRKRPPSLPEDFAKSLTDMHAAATDWAQRLLA